jgi:hypothetical protein
MRDQQGSLSHSMIANDDKFQRVHNLIGRTEMRNFGPVRMSWVVRERAMRKRVASV